MSAQAQDDPRTAAEALVAAGDAPGALALYEAALARAPDDPDLLAGLARMAQALSMADVALTIWERAPASLEALDGRARALAGLGRPGEAIELLRAALLADPGEARLWNALGVVVNEEGDGAAARTFFAEAVRLAPGLAAARYNLGDVRFDLGELDGAEADFREAWRLAGPSERATIAFAQAQLLLHRGELARGWPAYAARLDPLLPGAPAFDAPGRRWRVGEPLAGRRLLVLGEQGLGDEIMLLGLVGDLLDALGPDGGLVLAVDPRFVSLARRSFPRAQVRAHTTERRDGRPWRGCHGTAPDTELWAPLGDLPQAFRGRLEDFPRRAYLRADPARVAGWRRWLGGRAAVGLSWRSGMGGARRRRHAPPLTALQPLLAAAPAFVHLQYDAAEDELAALDALAPRPLLRPPGLDLKNDLEGLAALCVALGHVVSIPNATAALSAACGVRTDMLAAPHAWPRLGTDGYPWYARARSYAAPAFGDWTPAVAALARAVVDEAG